MGRSRQREACRLPGFAYGRTTSPRSGSMPRTMGSPSWTRLIDERPDGSPFTMLTRSKESRASSCLRHQDVEEGRRATEEQAGGRVDINRSAKLDGIILGDSRYLEFDLGPGEAQGKNYKPDPLGLGAVATTSGTFQGTWRIWQSLVIRHGVAGFCPRITSPRAGDGHILGRTERRAVRATCMKKPCPRGEGQG